MWKKQRLIKTNTICRPILSKFTNIVRITQNDHKCEIARLLSETWGPYIMFVGLNVVAVLCYKCGIVTFYLLTCFAKSNYTVSEIVGLTSQFAAQN